jgi:hypothetical protein
VSPIITDILQGKFDADLASIITAAGERRKLVSKALAAVTLHEIGVGQKVRVLNIRPSYMIGKVGKVVEKTRTRFVVEFEGEVGRFGSGKVTVPASCVEAV